jgi:hypothetical protein
MPKPYAILAAALIANGRSLSTATLTTPRERPALTPIYGSEDRFVDSDSVGIFDFESHLAAEPLAKRALVNTAASSA